MKSIIIIIDYFGGQWPRWFPFYLESCRRNPDITWLIHTDCPVDSFNIKNVIFRSMTRAAYIRHVSERLQINFAPADDYKLCDLKPTRGVLFEEEIRGYDFFGYGDIDVIYGDIRRFYTAEVLKNNVLSTSATMIAGHLALFRNSAWLRNAFRRVKDWRQVLEDSVYRHFDEDMLIEVFRYPAGLSPRQRFFYDLLRPRGIKYRHKLYLQEQFTTPLTPMRWRDGSAEHPTVWFWQNGRVTDRRQYGNEYIYLHFMNFKYGRYLAETYGDQTFWDETGPVIDLAPADISRGFMIDRYGFHPLD
ncbi:MAG: DUF6625 family protein [Patescibacteria group bacterium]